MGFFYEDDKMRWRNVKVTVNFDDIRTSLVLDVWCVDLYKKTKLFPGVFREKFFPMVKSDFAEREFRERKWRLIFLGIIVSIFLGAGSGYLYLSKGVMFRSWDGDNCYYSVFFWIFRFLENCLVCLGYVWVFLVKIILNGVGSN